MSALFTLPIGALAIGRAIASMAAEFVERGMAALTPLVEQGTKFVQDAIKSLSESEAGAKALKAVEDLRLQEQFERLATAPPCDLGKGDATDKAKCLGSTIANQLHRTIKGDPGAENQLSVGLESGEIPILPFGALLACVFLGIALRVIFGRQRFMRKRFSSFTARLTIFVAVFAFMMSVVKEGEAAMKAQDPSQGPNFLPVTQLTTGGPYQHTRNPMYSCVMLLVPAVAMLADSLWMAAAMSLMPLYLDRFVIPAEEALLKRLFGGSFDEYAASVPRWFAVAGVSVGPEALLLALIVCLIRLLTPRAHQLAGLKFYYFPVAARGDCARLALTLRKIRFKDMVIEPAKWADLKPKTPWSSMPFVELADGRVLGQSYAIFRLIGKGTGLYPEDPILAARVDECMDGLNDVGSVTNKTGQGLAGAEKLKKRGAACKEGGDIFVACARVEACYERAGTPGPFLTGELTIADLHVFAQVGWATSGFFDGVDSEFLVAFPLIQAVRKAVISIPRVAAFYKAEAKKPYMKCTVGGHPAKECYERMIKTSLAA